MPGLRLPSLGRSAGLKMYLDSTFGQLRLDDMTLWQQHFQHWPKHMPIVAHSESRSMAAVILMAAHLDRPVHIAHISLKEEILLIKAAKERGIKVTCEVCPHHLFLSRDDIPAICQGHPGRGEVRPRLASRRMWMLCGPTSTSSTVSPRTTPRTPWPRKMVRTLHPDFPGWKPSCRFC